MVMGFVPQHTFADGFAAYVTDASGNTTHYTNFRSAWNYAVSINNAIVGTNESYLNHAGENSYVVPEGKTVTVELNGHYLCRNITSSMDDGNVFNVQNNATLIVYGGNKDNPAYNSGESHTQSVYLPNSKRDGYDKTNVTLYGGLIYGGNCCNGGGGIMMGERSNVHLHNVTVAGNYADSYFLKWGDGGGVYMNGKYGRLYMTDSRICYNCAHDDGGGILVCEDYCTINMVRSHIDHNIADDDGGGIFVEGENFKLCGDAKQFRDPETMITTYGINNWDGAYNYFIPDMLGSSVSYNCVYHSETGGGGIYLYKKTALIEGVNIAGNYANDSWTDGYGGGIYVDDKEITIRNCNILRNKANAKGGGIYEDGGESAIDCCTVYGNMAWGNSGCGGGIYVSASDYLAVSGPVIVNENQSQINGTLDNLYLDTGNDGEIDTTSFLIPSTTPGADVHVRLSPARTKRIHISKNPGTYDITHFSYDNDNTHYIGWGENTHRYLSVVEGTKPQPPEVVTFTPDNGKRTQSAGSYAGYPLIKGVFNYPSFPDDNADVENVFYYSDGFFAGIPNIYNEHLATASLCLAASAGYSNIPNADGKISEGNALTVRNDYLDKSKNFRQFVSDIGCKDENIYVNDFNLQKPGADTIGVGIASKPIFDDKTLVIIGVRGMGYESEWISNMTLGSTGEAAGWSSAATQVMAELTDYLARKRINGSSENTIFWIAGYSRAGATSNLTAKRIVDTYDNNGTHTFAYPLEAPMGGVESNIIAGHNYNCIHNVINQNDIVPWVGTTEMGFIRYGVDHYVPGSTDTNEPYDGSDNNRIPEDNTAWDVEGSSYQSQRSKMLAQLAAVNPDIVFDDYFHQATVNYIMGLYVGSVDPISETGRHEDEIGTTEHFIDFFFRMLQDYAFKYNINGDTVDENKWTPRQYFSGYPIENERTFQQAAAATASLIFGKSDEDVAGLMDCFGGLTARLNAGQKLSLYTNLDHNGVPELKSNIDDIWNTLTIVSEEDRAKGYRPIGDFLTDEEEAELRACYKSLLFPLLCFAAEDYTKYSQDILGTMAYNIPRIISNHYPEVTHAWLRSYDSFYTNDTSPVTMAATSVSAPSAVAVEVTHSDYTTNTFDPTTGTINVLSTDTVRLVPADEADRDTGEAIYYQFTSGVPAVQVTHAFADPFHLDTMQSNYSCDGTFTLKAVAAHSGVRLEPVTITLKLDSDKKYFKGHSLSLDGDIGINFYIALTADELVHGAVVNFTWNVEGNTKTSTDTDLSYDNDTGYYIATCHVAPAEMTYDVTAVLNIGDEEKETDVYSVKKYAYTIINSEKYRTEYINKYGEIKYNKLVALVRAMLDYGARAQLAFDRNIANLANNGVYTFNDEVTPEMITSTHSDMTENLDNYGLSYQYTTVVFQTGAALRHYYRITDKDKFDAVKDGITFGGIKAEPINKGNLIYFELANISAENLGVQYGLIIGTNTYSYSVIDRTKSLLESDDDTKFKNLAKAVYYYNRKALEFSE